MTVDGERHGYDSLVLATGSYAFVPPVPGHGLPACHAYRTLDGGLDHVREVVCDDSLGLATEFGAAMERHRHAAGPAVMRERL